MGTMPTRVDMELFNAAKATGAVHSRSAAQQIAHWARIGREFESMANVRHRDIEAVLRGDGSYDALQERELGGRPGDLGRASRRAHRHLRPRQGDRATGSRLGRER